MKVQKKPDRIFYIFPSLHSFLWDSQLRCVNLDIKSILIGLICEVMFKDCLQFFGGFFAFYKQKIIASFSSVIFHPYINISI